METADTVTERDRHARAETHRTQSTRVTRRIALAHSHTAPQTGTTGTATPTGVHVSEEQEVYRMLTKEPLSRAFRL